MAIIAYGLPIVPGQTEAARNLSVDLDSAGHRAVYEELNRSAGVTRHEEWIQHLPTGDLLVVVFETATPQLLAREFSDTEYDRWWRARVERIHGFDPAQAGALPELIYAWSAELKADSSST